MTNYEELEKENKELYLYIDKLKYKHENKLNNIAALIGKYYLNPTFDNGNSIIDLINDILKK